MLTELFLSLMLTELLFVRSVMFVGFVVEEGESGRLKESDSRIERWAEEMSAESVRVITAVEELKFNVEELLRRD